MKPALDFAHHPLSTVVLAACLLAGCSGIKPYPDHPEKNLQLSTKTDSGSPFSSVRAALDIYRVDQGCQMHYEGTVDLRDSSLAIGIPVGEPSYLAFAFNSSSWLGSSQGSITYDTLLTPRPGYEYDVEVSYADDMYDVVIREIDPRGGARRDIAPELPENCVTR